MKGGWISRVVRGRFTVDWQVHSDGVGQNYAEERAKRHPKDTADLL